MSMDVEGRDDDEAVEIVLDSTAIVEELLGGSGGIETLP